MAECLILLIYPEIADIRSRKFYVEPVAVITAILAVIRFIRQPYTGMDLLLGCIPGFITLVICLITGEAIGKGDAAVITGLGMIAGWEDTCVICMIGLLLCGMLGLLLIILKKSDRKTGLPFIPFLMMGVLIVWCIRR